MIAQNRGVLFVLLSAITIGSFHVLVHEGVRTVPPLAFAFITHVCALGGAVMYGLYKGTLSELANFKNIRNLLVIALTIIVFPLTLFYVGARLTSGVNTSALTLSEIIFTVLFAQLWGEHLTQNKVFGALAIFCGAILLLYHHGGAWQLGDFIIMISTITYPVGNFLQKKILKEISPASLLVGRLVLALPFLYMFHVLSNETVEWRVVWDNHWLMILVIGLITSALGKIFWFEGLKTLDVTTGVSLNMTFPIFSVLILWFLGTETVSMKQVVGIGIMLVGVYYALQRAPKKSLPNSI